MVSKKIGTLFLENFGIKQTIFKNTFWLFFAEGISRILDFILIVFITRSLGASEFGKFVFALAFVSIIIIFSDLGLSDITTRNIAQDKENKKEYSAAFSLKFFLNIAVILISIALSFFVTKDPEIREVIWIMSFFIAITSFFGIIYSFLRANQKMEYEALFRILQMFLITLAVSFSLINHYSVKGLALSYLTANTVAFLFIIILFHFLFFPLRICFNFSLFKKYLLLSWPLSFGFTAGWFYININLATMGGFGQILEAGWYGAAYKIAGIFVVSAGIVSQSFYSALSSLFKKSKEEFQKIWNYHFFAMGALAFPILIGGLILAPKLISFFYGQGYYPSIIIIRILFFVVFIDFIYYSYALALVSANKQGKFFYAIFTGIILNIFLSILLVPYFNFYGAAVSTIVSSLASLLIVAFFCKQLFLKKYFSRENFIFFGIFLVSSFVMGIVILQPFIYNFNIFVIVAIGILTYGFLLSLFFRNKLILIFKKNKEKWKNL